MFALNIYFFREDFNAFHFACVFLDSLEGSENISFCNFLKAYKKIPVE